MWQSLVIATCLLGMAAAAGRPYLPSTYSAPPRSVHGSVVSQQAQPHVEYEKHFYYYSAPEEKSQPQTQPQAVPKAKKNLQVVVVKAPENRGFERAVAELVRQHSAPSPTHIYVLNKQPNVAAHVQQVAARRSPKPEVHFVQYHSAAEAQQVQQAISQQYGSGGGSRRPVRDEAASVLNFVDAGWQAAQTSSVDQAFAEPPTVDSTPVDKHYARNFLPTGVDVVPGSSYIPLVAYRQ